MAVAVNDYIVGEVMLFAGNFAPHGWLPCDGGTYALTDYQDLFDILGFSYGGNGSTTFAVPNLQGQSPLGSGDYGQYLICWSGVDISSAQGTMGELRLLARPLAPGTTNNWATCSGQPVAINPNQALFSILGTNYGGDGSKTFALPNLVGKPPLTQGSYVMCTRGIYPDLSDPTGSPRDLIGAVRIFCGPTGEGRQLVNYLVCAGQTVVIRQNTAFFSVIGTYYGGDGKDTYQLPNLVGRSPAEVADNPHLVFGAYLICQSGIYPMRS